MVNGPGVMVLADDMMGLVDPAPWVVFAPCESSGIWHNGHQRAISAQWPLAVRRMRSWFRFVLKRFAPGDRMGECLCTHAASNVHVALGVCMKDGLLDLLAFTESLYKAAQHCVMTRSSLHIEVGDALSIMDILNEIHERFGIMIYVYLRRYDGGYAWKGIAASNVDDRVSIPCREGMSCVSA